MGVSLLWPCRIIGEKEWRFVEASGPEEAASYFTGDIAEFPVYVLVANKPIEVEYGCYRVVRGSAKLCDRDDDGGGSA